MKSVLTIAGSDPSGGAGIEADLPVFKALGVQGRTAITALTVQAYLPFARGGHREAVGGVEQVRSTSPGFADPSLQRRGMYPTPPDILREILITHTRPLPDAIKIGMIGSRANLEVICDFLERHSKIPVVLDTVFAASSGLALLEESALPLFKTRLMKLATVVTPNLPEAGRLLGRNIQTIEEMKSAAQELHQQTWGAQQGHMVVIKGGHLAGDAVDVAWNGQEYHCEPAPRVAGTFRGTGCRFSAAMACGLAQDKPVLQSIQDAKRWLINYFLPAMTV